MKPIFSRNDDIDKIAFLNWRISKKSDILNLINIADGFLTAAIRLAKSSIINNKDKTADIVIFPILTNANHGIELYLKAIMWTLNTIVDSEFKIEGSHNIQQIFNTVKSKIETYGGGLSLEAFNERTIGLSAYINELVSKISSGNKKDNMDFSRYPFNTKYENHFYVDQIGNVEIDLENFVSRFEQIHGALDEIASFLYEIELRKNF